MRNISKDIENLLVLPSVTISADGETTGAVIDYAGKYIGICATLYVGNYTAGKASLKLEVLDINDNATLVSDFESPSLEANGNVNVNLSKYDLVQSGKKVRLSLVSANSSNFTASITLTGSTSEIDFA